MKLKHPLFKRVLSALVALALLSCCTVPWQEVPESVAPPSQPAPVPVPRTEVRLPWLPDDTLNQYTCETLQNFYLAGLLCDPLVALDKDNKVVKRLALNISPNSTGSSYVVTLRSDAVFADGSALTAEDLLYSLELARGSPRFATGLAGITEATAQGPATVAISLEKPDALFERSLIFPLIKAGTGEQSVPVGVGRFNPNLTRNSLERNMRYYNPVKNIEHVALVETDSPEAQSYSLMEGTIDLMYSAQQSDNRIGLGASYRQIPLSNLVYMWVNTEQLGTDVRLRQAISGLISREELVHRAYSGFGSVTTLPISPLAAATSLDIGDLEVSVPRQVALLEALGWKADENGVRRRPVIPGKAITPLELLVNTESAERRAAADMIAAMLQTAGLEVVVTALPFAQYQARLNAGEYQLCIAEQRMAYNMDISTLVLPEKSPIKGVPVVYGLPGRLDAVRAGTTELAELETMLRDQLPVIPLLFRRGILCFSRDFSVNIVATEQDIFYNINEW